MMSAVLLSCIVVACGLAALFIPLLRETKRPAGLVAAGILFLGAVIFLGLTYVGVDSAMTFTSADFELRVAAPMICAGAAIYGLMLGIAATVALLGGARAAH
jgi:hypothetical protein